MLSRVVAQRCRGLLEAIDEESAAHCSLVKLLL
jgi:hypothetical protein